MRKMFLLTAMVLLIAGGFLYAQESASSPAQTSGGAGKGAHMGNWQAPIMSPELNLTADQKTRINGILQDRGNQLKAVREDATLSQEQKKAKAQDILKAGNSQIEAVLTPDQQAKLKQLRADAAAKTEKQGGMMGGMQRKDQNPGGGMMMQSMMEKSMVATSDGGVVVLIGNTLYKYDKDLSLKQKVEIKMDMDAMRKMMEQCPMYKEGMQKSGKE